MTDVHVFGVVRAAGTTAPRGSRLVTHRDVAALVADAQDGRPSPSALLRDHWRILEKAGRTATVVPLRFGTVMPGDAAVVEDLLAPAHDGLVAQLARLEGKVQVTVKADYLEEALMREVVASSPAIARLRERVRGIPEDAAYFERVRLGELVAAEVEKVRARDAARILEGLEPFALATRAEPVTRPDAVLNAALLIERERVGHLQAGVRRLRSELDGRIEVRLIGPLPAYSFAERIEIDREAAWA